MQYCHDEDAFVRGQEVDVSVVPCDDEKQLRVDKDIVLVRWPFSGHSSQSGILASGMFECLDARDRVDQVLLE